MHRWLPAGLVAAVVALGLVAGCGGDLYGECAIEAGSDEALQDCAREDGSDDVSCVVENLECETGTCGRYRSSNAFCTVECADDGDCPNGECREFVYQSGQTYCVSDVHLRDDDEEEG